jgi:NAD-dependent deacetylase
MESREDQLDALAWELAKRRTVVALTGAGISVDSGIPDFRSRGGLWERFDPMEYATIEAFEADPHRVWRMFAELQALVVNARPNPGHLALSRLEHAGVLEGIVTQNVDNLHQEAGSREVVEFHGNGSRLRCLRCDALVDPPAGWAPAAGPPLCGCGRALKPDVVLFGEAIPPEALVRAAELAERCRAMLIVGTSATVAPASLLPLVAKRNGALLVEVNLGPTEITDLCDVALHEGASSCLPLLADRVDALVGSLGHA